MMNVARLFYGLAVKRLTKRKDFDRYIEQTYSL